MKILLVSGIVPPAIGGPAEYAKELLRVWRVEGHEVVVLSYTIENRLPSGIRHLVFFVKMLFVIRGVEKIVALDTFSVGFSAACIARLFGKEYVIRVGGDFLWEGYVERTKELVLLRDFYTTTREKWNRKEKIIFVLTRFTLRSATTVAFNTSWQKEMWEPVYGLDTQKTKVVENFFPLQEAGEIPEKKVFIGSTRKLVWKNIPMLESAFQKACEKNPDISLETRRFPHDAFLQEIKKCYAIILVSLGDIGPNLLIDAVRFGKPFIATCETGLRERFKDVGIFVDPKNEQEIADAILWLSDENNYRAQCEKIRQFAYTHSWEAIAKELLQ